MTDVLESVFRTILTMSVTATVAALVVMLIRLPLKKAPKAVSYGLWFVVLFRLICPVSFQSAWSFFNLRHTASALIADQSEGLSGAQEAAVTATVGTGTAAVEPAAISPIVPTEQPPSIMMILALVWAVGALGLLTYGIISYLKTTHSIRAATRLSGNIYESDLITSPFVCGFFRPKIYLPVSLSDHERDYILLHEQTHVRRRDYIVKPIWFLAVCVHWFNPVVWASYILMGHDIEMSCDEAVIRKMGDAVRADYSTSLLALSAPPRPLLTAGPLAFGESHTFSRIKNVLNFKKPVLWGVLLAILAAVATIFVLASNPLEKTDTSLAREYLQYKTDTVEDISNVDGIVSLLEFPEGISAGPLNVTSGGLTNPYIVRIYLNTDSASVKPLSSDTHMTIYQKNAAILFALVGNADSVRLAFDSNVLTYSREEINALYGTDVRIYAESASAFMELLGPSASASETGGVETPETTAITVSSAPLGEASYAYGRIDKDDLAYTISPFGADDAVLAEQIIEDFMLKSAAWDALDISQFDTCFLIRQSYPDGTVLTYYAFMYDGKACLQFQDIGQYSIVDTALYDALGQFIDASETAAAVEVNLSDIMSSPLESSRPGDYINAHRKEYEVILKLGQPALDYMLSCFEAGENLTLKGHIMVALCQDLLGPGYSFPDEYLSPAEWYAKIKNRDNTVLPE